MTSFSALQDSFVAYLPYLRGIAGSQFCHLDPETREEQIQNTVALAWKFYSILFQKGRVADPGILKSILRYALLQTRARRTPQGKMRAKDVLECGLRGKVRFEKIDLNEFVGRRTSVPDQVAFRIDTPAFLETLTLRQRAIACDLAMEMTTSEVARKYGVTPGRVSQFRREFKSLYDAFFGE